MTRTGDWIQTFTGKKFFPLDPRPEEVDIKDIAHALSQVCRFAGHTQSFYSVAQHSLIVATACPPEYRLWGLLHDASEAYIGDMTRPLKRSMFAAGITFYKDAEARIMRAVCERFGLPPEEPAAVKHADNRVLFTERRDLLGHSVIWDDWTGNKDVAPLETSIVPVLPSLAKWAFLEAYGKCK